MAANGGTHIVVANEPRSYRESLAGVLRVERPHDAVTVCDPAHLPELGPLDIVVCSQLPAGVAERAGGWLVLRRDGGVARSSVPDVEAMAYRPGLHAVLAAIERIAAAVAQLR